MSLEFLVDRLTWTKNAVTGNYDLAPSTVANPITGFPGNSALFLDGSGSFSAPPSSTPGTPVNSIQFNSPLGSFAGDLVFTFDKLTKLLSSGSVTLSPVVAPTSALIATVTATSGNPSGTYYYIVTYITAQGETSFGTTSLIVVTGGSFQINLSNIPISTDSRVIGRKIYRKPISNAGGAAYLIGTINDNTTTTLTDNSANGTANFFAYNTTSAIYWGSLQSILINDCAGCGFDGSGGVVIGTHAGAALGANLLDNVLVGPGVGNIINAGSRNVGMGGAALFALTTGSDNVAIGDFAGGVTTTGNSNVFIGSGTGEVSGTSTSSNNTVIGAFAAFNGTNFSGDNNTAVGGGSLDVLSSGANNTTLGAGSGAQLVAGSGNLCLGYLAGPTTDQSNKLFVDITQRNDPLIGGDFSTRTLYWSSNQTVPMLTASLPSCGSGTWGTRAAVTDATLPAIGVALTGGGAVFATVHCSKTGNVYMVDGL